MAGSRTWQRVPTVRSLWRAVNKSWFQEKRKALQWGNAKMVEAGKREVTLGEGFFLIDPESVVLKRDCRFCDDRISPHRNGTWSVEETMSGHGCQLCIQVILIFFFDIIDTVFQGLSAGLPRNIDDVPGISRTLLHLSNSGQRNLVIIRFFYSYAAKVFQKRILETF